MLEGGGETVRISRIRLLAVIGLCALALAASSLAGCVGGSGGAGPLDPSGAEDSGGDEESSGDGAGGSDGGSDGTGGNGTDDGDGSGDGGNETEGDDGDGQDNPGGNGNQTDGGDGEGGGDNETGDPSDPWAGDDPQWPPLAQADVRPGVRVAIGPEHCTSNFLFRDRLYGSLYLGIAAHCVEHVGLGSDVAVYGVDGNRAMDATVVYSSWRAIGFDPQVGLVGDDVHPHDFALVELPSHERDRVHPSLLHYGGPTELADWSQASVGDWVLSYGNSGMRPVDLLSPQQGYVVDTHSTTKQGKEGHFLLAHMAAPPMPGDSGSALITEGGRALGLLSAVTVGTPYGAWWEYSSLPHALAFAEGYGDWDLELVTWEFGDSLP